MFVAAVCPSVDIRNSLDKLAGELEDCTVVEGFVQIVLIGANANWNHTYPKLREITGYLVLYRASGLISLRQLFPNLSVIRCVSAFLQSILYRGEAVSSSAARSRGTIPRRRASPHRVDRARSGCPYFFSVATTMGTHWDDGRGALPSFTEFFFVLFCFVFRSGQSLFFNNALVVYEMMQLQELGLSSLTDIPRGAVHIEKNPSLCFVDTIDWNLIAKSGRDDHFIAVRGFDRFLVSLVVL